MKDLTDYFGSPSKTVDDSNLEDLEENSLNKTSENRIQIQRTDNPKDIKNKKQKKRKKGKRKQSDPVVKNIADLLDSSLCIISPNTSFNCLPETHTGKGNNIQKECDTNKSVGNEVAIKQEEVVILEDESNSYILPKDDTSQSNLSSGFDNKHNDCVKSNNKLNAFQFMMESRKKSIGRNSPGKESPEDEDKIVDEKELKKVLSARKSLFQNWADKKGATKRKREEEEKEEIISYKMRKRAKRLKKLLQVDQSKDAEKDIILEKAKKRIKQISTSSSENSKDSTRETVVLVEDSNTGLTNSVLEVIEENAQDRVLNDSKTKESKQGLLSFFGVINKTKKSEVVGKQAGDMKQNDRETFKAGISKSRKKKSNCNTEEVNNSLKEVIIEDSSTEESIMVKNSKHKKRKKIVDEASQESVAEKSRMSKTPKSRTKDEGYASFTPRSAKSWKMKIKMNEENTEEQKVRIEERRTLRTKRKPNYEVLLSDDSCTEDKTRFSEKKSKTKVSEIDEVIVCSDDELVRKKKDHSKKVKVAPVFVKASPKPKPAPEVVEARKQFLLSGIPDSLKKTMEKQQSTEEREYDVFPTISHVQQKCETQQFWNLSQPQLDLKNDSPVKVEKPKTCANLTNSCINTTLNIKKEVEKVDKLKTLLNRIKSDNPNYPVYKSFRLIYEKTGKSSGQKKEVTPKPKRGRKRRSKSVEIIENIKPDHDPIEYSMWTDKYKPKCSEDIIGNTEGVKNLKKWLELWKNFSEEINARRKKKREYCSDSEFESTDCDSRDSTKLPGNTVVVGGPCGSGKSSAIYAICYELGFNVIELNASSKRTGKRLLQELQEATQSHQVRKKKQGMQSFLKSDTPKETKEQLDKKMCVLLIEDVDIVFEQDDGFISALYQLVNTSKRPIVLTTTDASSVFVQKFVSQYEYIPFLPLSSQSLATWLQIVCLVEGLFVNQGDVGSLLEFNKGDVRKTLLQLQFWVQSGGQIIRDDLPLKTKAKVVATEHKVLDDEPEPCLQDEINETREVFVHSDCIRSFEIFRHHRTFRVPFFLNLGSLWWNMPNILGIPSFSEQRIQKFRENHFETEKNTLKTVLAVQNKKLSPIKRQKLDCLSKLYDSLAFTDISFRTVNHFDGLEPGVTNYTNGVRDSLELEEAMDGYDGYKDFVHDITHNLVNGYMEEYIGIENCESVLNIAVPEKAERRWRAKMHVCQDVFQEALPLSTHTERRSVALDYMPCLRNISRSESRRAANNTKRGNRFRNYLRDLGIKYNDKTIKLACNILMEDS